MARPATDIQHRIVHAARERFLIDGVDGASLRTIARQARTSIGMVSYYFETKDHLFLAVVEEIYAQLLADLAQALEPGRPVRERLTAAFSRLGGMDGEELAVVRLMMREALLSSTRLGKLVARMQRGHLPLVLGALNDGVKEGVIDPSLPLPLVLMCAGALGAAPQLLSRVLPALASMPLPPRTRLASLSVDLLLRAVGPPARGKRRPLRR